MIQLFLVAGDRHAEPGEEIGAPLVHRVYDRNGRLTQVGQGVFGLRRNDGIDLAGDDAVRLHLAELLELFTEDACLFGFLNGKFERGSIEQFYRNVDTVGAGENFKTRIDVLELEETLAVVRVLEEGWGGKIDFTDVLLLLKIDGEWKCVAKAYNQNSNTIEK